MDAVTPALTRVSIDTLVPYANNPRDNSAAIAAVAESIKDFGFLVPIVVDRDLVIVAGHTRYQAAISLGLTEVPIIRADHMTEAQANAFRLIDNKTAELAAWDFDKLAAEISGLREVGIDLLPFGWSQEELDCLGDVVAEDCLDRPLDEDVEHQQNLDRRLQGGGDGITGAIQTNKGSNVVSKDPSSVRFACGEINFFVPIEFYREWAHELRKRNGFDMERVIGELAERLGVEARGLGNKTAAEREAEEAAMQAAKTLEAMKTGKPRAEIVAKAAIENRKTKTAGKTLKRITAPNTASVKAVDGDVTAASGEEKVTVTKPTDVPAKTLKKATKRVTKAAA